MSLIQHSPFNGFEGIANTMNNFFHDFDSSISSSKRAFSPRVDINESEKSIQLMAELPGIPKDKVKVTINDGNLLTIKGTKASNWELKSDNEENSETESPTLLKEERSYGEFTRSFRLPENIDNESIKGNFKNGMLEIMLDKKEPEKPKEIEIEIN